MNETIKNIPLGELHPFPDHPFGVRDDEAMEQTVESIREYGVLVPAIARPREEGGYELIAGHRRKHACEIAGLKTMPVIVRDLDRNAAVIIMVDSNIQRENILPSERAKAYKMKLEAIKRQGVQQDLTSTQPVQKLSVEKIADEAGVSRENVRRYIRLTKLEPQLMQMVDEGKIGMTPAVEISYLKPEEQKLLIETIDSEQATPSFSQAQRMKKLSQEGKLNDDAMLGIMMEQKKPENWDLMPEDAERKGLGTPATRAGIIEKLIATGFVERKKAKKSVNLTPANTGVSLITVLPEQLQSPLLTAEWEHKLKMVEHGEMDADTFMAEISLMVSELIKTYSVIKGAEVLFPSGRDVIGKRPRCGGDVTESKKGFFCETNDCRFGLWRDNKFLTSKKISLSKKMAATLLKNSRIPVKGIFSEKTGKSYDATLVMTDDGAKTLYNLDFGK